MRRPVMKSWQQPVYRHDETMASVEAGSLAGRIGHSSPICCGVLIRRIYGRERMSIRLHKILKSAQEI